MIERRNISIQELTDPEVETRTEGNEQGQRKIILYGALFNTQSRLITEKINGETRSFYETIERDALTEADLSEIIYNTNHNSENIIARKSAGNLEVRITERGLLGEATIPDETNATTIQNDTIKNIKQRNYRENSFAFRVAQGGDVWERRNGVLHRTIKRIAKVVDLSTVLTGAYPADILFTRSLNENEVKEVNTDEPVVYDAQTINIDFEFSLLKSKSF